MRFFLPLRVRRVTITLQVGFAPRFQFDLRVFLAVRILNWPRPPRLNRLHFLFGEMSSNQLADGIYAPKRIECVYAV